MNNTNLTKQINLLPRSSGIYKFLSQTGEILYIGKALNLSNRVPSYFKDTHYDRPHIIPMIPLIENIEIIETENEIEALILESALIKEHQPRFNVMLKDDKSYAWIYIATKEKFPSVRIVRTIKKGEFKGGRLFGPFPSGYTVKRIFNYLRKLFPFCNCKNDREEKLYFEMGLCPGPNIGEINSEDYRRNINNLIEFLSGRVKRPVLELEKQMREYASNRNFEKAALLRDKINDLRYLSTKIKVNFFEGENKYVEKKKIMINSEIQDFLKLLEIDKSVHRIECYDISNISGAYSYGSMTVAIDSELKSNHYRIFKIKTVEGANDFASLREVIGRRVQNINKNIDESLSLQPDIFLIDGGKQQLGQVKDLIPQGSLLVGITKGRKYKKSLGKRRDEFWFWNSDADIIVQVHPKSHHLFTRLRDEAHRFAIKHNRIARIKGGKKSVLDKIDGIGEKRKKLLIKEFGSVDGIIKAGYENINRIIKNKKIVETLITELQKSKKD